MELQIGIECDPTIYDSLTKAFQSILVTLFEEFEISGVNYDFQNKVDYTIGSKLRKIIRLNYGN